MGERVRFYFDPIASDNTRGDIEPWVVEVLANGVDGVIPLSEVDDE